MMKTAIALATVLAVGLAMPSTDSNAVEWENYKQAHGKSYESAEMDAVRKNIYFQNKDKVVAHNERYKQGLVTYSLKLNHFADQTPEEIAALRGLKTNGIRTGNWTHQITNDELPASVDWRTKGVVTQVKNQGQCGSCWAFSTTGSVEGQWAIKKEQYISLSEQQLVDCSKVNDGCGGGLMDDAFTYIQQNKGIDSEASYPYTSEGGSDFSCSFNKSNVVATVTGHVDIKKNSESDLQDAVFKIGPISIGIDASEWSFSLYSSGVYSSSTCSSVHLDHGVLAVGYGVENGTPYWLVKNSWGPGWGAAGYIKMSRNKDNQCGIATAASYPLI